MGTQEASSDNQPFWRICGLATRASSPGSSARVPIESFSMTTEPGFTRQRSGPFPPIEGCPRDLNPRCHDDSSDNQPFSTSTRSIDACSVSLAIADRGPLSRVGILFRRCVCVCVRVSIQQSCHGSGHFPFAPTYPTDGPFTNRLFIPLRLSCIRQQVPIVGKKRNQI